MGNSVVAKEVHDTFRHDGYLLIIKYTTVQYSSTLKKYTSFCCFFFYLEHEGIVVGTYSISIKKKYISLFWYHDVLDKVLVT